MRTLLLAAALLLVTAVLPPVASSLVRAQDGQVSGTEPVPLELLKGRSLVLEQGNCSTDAPVGFEWLASPGMTEKHPDVRMFLCRDSKQSNIFMLQVYDKVFAQLDAKGMEEFLTGAQGSMEQQGWVFQKREFKPAKFPIEGSSFRFQVQLLRKDKQVLYWIGYVTTAQRMYCLSSMQLEDGERPEFNSFVKSFRLLKPVSSPGRFGNLLPYVLLSFIVGSVVVVINTRRQKKEEEAKKAAAAGEKGDKPAKGDKAKGDKAKGDPGDEDDDDDVTDAFKVKPIVPTAKGKTRRDVEVPAPKEKSRTRRDEPRPAKPARDEESKQRRDRDRDRRDEKSDRERHRERKDEKSDRERDRERRKRDDDNERPFG